MNKLGIFYVYWSRNWAADFNYYALKTARLGFEVFEVHADPVRDLSDGERKRLKQTLENEGLEITFCTGLSRECDVSAADPAVRRAGIEYLKRTIELVNKMGGTQLSGILYGSWNPETAVGLSKDEYWQRSIESMREVIETAEDYNVCCNVEVVNRFEQFLINTCEEAVQYVNAVESPNLRIHLDTYHMNIEEDSLEKAIFKAGGKLGHFHVGENNRKLPGQGGHIPWESVFNGLSRINYQHRIVMEPFLIPGGDIAYDVKLWRDLSRGLDFDEEARKALNFLRKRLQAASA